MSDAKRQESSAGLALRTPDEKTAARYREQCEWRLERAFGKDKSLHIDSVELFSVYKFSLAMTGLNRFLEQRVGGGQGSGEKDFLNKDIWTVAEEGQTGDFAVAIPGSTTEEACHQCGGKKTCRHCGGTGKSDCRECSGNGKCDECGGLGLQTCPSCRGSGKVETSVWVNCSFCHGSGLQWGGPNHGGPCPQCHGRGQEEKPAHETCPSCGGDGKTTCKACGGTKRCGICGGTGKTECKKCSGSGKCKECGASGKVKYSWWCVQEELSLCQKKSMEDKADEIQTAHTWNNDDCWRDREDEISTVCNIETQSSVCEVELLDKEYPSPCLVNKGENEEEATTVAKTFSQLWKNVKENLLAKTKDGYGSDFRIIRQKYKIERIPVVAKFVFSMFGKKGVLLQDLTDTCDWNGDVRKIEREYRRKVCRHAFLRTDLWLAATLLVAGAIVAMPFIWSANSVSAYLKNVFSPALITGIGAFLAVRFLTWYFYSYVWDLAELERRTRSWSELGAGVKGYDYKVWTSGNTDNIKRCIRLLWVLMPIVVVQGLYAKIPLVASFLAPTREWFAAISSVEWSYIAGVCALKAAIIWASKKWEWKFAVEKSLIVLLAAFALAFVVWPCHLPEGLAFRSVMEQVLPYVALPVRFLGLAVYWPILIMLWALGFVGRMAVSLVMWIVSLFM